MPSSHPRSVATLASTLVLGLLLSLPAAVTARQAHSAKVSAKATCARFSPAAVGKALGVGVKHAVVRDSLALPVGDRTLGFECGFEPSTPSEKHPRGENVAALDISRTNGTNAKLRKLISSYKFPGTAPTKVGGIGSVTYVDLTPTGGSPEELPQVLVFVLSHHKIFYVFSQQVSQSAAEALAKLAASRL